MTSGRVTTSQAPIGWEAGFRGPWCLKHYNEDLDVALQELELLREMLHEWMRDQDQAAASHRENRARTLNRRCRNVRDSTIADRDLTIGPPMARRSTRLALSRSRQGS